MEDRFLKRLGKKARKGFRGWPMATVAFYGPDLSRASKVAVGIIRGECQEVDEMRDWHSANSEPENLSRLAGSDFSST